MTNEPRANQHYIPRFLLKRFGWCVNPDKRRKHQVFHVYVVKSDGSGKPKEINIEHLASEYFFYDKGGVGGVEELLSKGENAYSKTLDKIIAKGSIEKSQQDRVSAFMALMSIRTKYIRDQMTDAGYHVAHKALEQARV